MLYQALINKCSVLSDCIPPMGYKHENKSQILKINCEIVLFEFQ